MQDKKTANSYKYKKGERKLLLDRTKRFEVMLEKKKKLGINDKCDRMDVLYTPHLVSLENPNTVAQVQTNRDFDNDDIILEEQARKSMPLAFEKITTAQAVMIKEHPKAVMKAEREQFKDLNNLIENIYYENFRIQRKLRVLRKYVYQLAKYGIGYWREYIKKTYRKQFYDENGEQKCKWVYDVFDVVAENIHPKNIILDNNCFAVKDVNKPANDCIILNYLTEDEFKAVYPEEKFENTQFVFENQSYMIEDSLAKDEKTTDGKQKIQVLIYENKYENLRETWANEIPIESVPLPGNELSINGGKWVEDGENYDGIGIGQIMEIYQPLIDDIVNADNERLRQLVRPSEDWFNGIELSDETEDFTFGSGNVRKFTGNKNDIIYNSPPPRTPSEAQQKEEIMEEIDRATFVPRNLAGTDDAKTAYQSAQNRESALRKLSIPLDSIKDTIEDCANLDLELYKIAYSEPLETYLLVEGDDEFDEAMSIQKAAEEKGYEDERIVEEKDGLYRRKFREFEFPLKVEEKPKEDTGENIPTGRIIEADEKMFWELLPDFINWRGRIEIIGESFIPISQVMREEQDKQTVMFILGIQATDEMGNPALTDASGVPYIIDKVRAIKDFIKINKNFNPDKYVVPMTMPNANQGAMNINPLEQKSEIGAMEQTGNRRPELMGAKLI